MCILMINEQIFGFQERIVRKVTLSGNGAHVFAPKEWVDEDVLIVRISKLDVRKEVLKILEENMENVVSAFLFGSYARGDTHGGSDVDVLVEFLEPISLIQLVSLENYLTGIVGVKVDVVPKEDIRKELKDTILKEAVYV